MKTMVTINKHKFDFDVVLAGAREQAQDGYVCPPDQNLANQTFNPQAFAFAFTVIRYFGRATNGYFDNYGLVDPSPEGVREFLLAKIKRLNKRAGTKALINKLGKEGAERYIAQKSGRKYDLQ